MKYPTRCRIIDVDGTGYQVGPHLAKTPDISKPHIGKEGLAAIGKNNMVVITLDDGNIIEGCDCWWEPLEGR